jgi:Uma2 family endonuclease
MRLAALFRGFDDYARAKGLGIVLFAPLDIFIRKLPRLRTRQPDLAYWSAGRVGGTSGTRFLNAREAGLPPDLVVEILSPDETRRRLASKLVDYASVGIGEVWLVGEQLEAIEVLVLADGHYQRAGLYGRGEAAESRVLAGFTLKVDTLFEDEG